MGIASGRQHESVLAAPIGGCHPIWFNGLLSPSQDPYTVDHRYRILRPQSAVRRWTSPRSVHGTTTSPSWVLTLTSTRISLMVGGVSGGRLSRRVAEPTGHPFPERAADRRGAIDRQARPVPNPPRHRSVSLRMTSERSTASREPPGLHPDGLPCRVNRPLLGYVPGAREFGYHGNGHDPTGHR